MSEKRKQNKLGHCGGKPVSSTKTSTEYQFIYANPIVLL